MPRIPIKLRTDVAAEVLPRTLSKSERRQLQILENVITLAARHGVEGLAYERIAQACGVTRHLVMHYFPERQDLVAQAMEYVWASLKLTILAAVDEAVGARAKMNAYIHANLLWTANHRDQAIFAVLHLHYASTKTQFLTAHSKLMKLGQERILGLIRVGVGERVFSAVADDALEAKSIQLAVLGCIISLITEDGPYDAETLAQKLSAEVWQRLKTPSKVTNRKRRTVPAGRSKRSG